MAALDQIIKTQYEILFRYIGTLQGHTGQVFLYDTFSFNIQVVYPTPTLHALEM